MKAGKDNPKIKLAKKLLSRKERDDRSKFLIEGPRLLEEALKSSFLPDYVLFSDKCRPGILDRLKKAGLELIETETETLEKISDTETSQGLIAVASRLKARRPGDIIVNDGFYIICDRIQDPGNLGTIIRTAAAASCSGVVIGDGSVDIYNPKVVRSSAGGIFTVPFIEAHDLREDVIELKDNGVKIFYAGSRAGKSLYGCAFERPFAVIIGNEASGVKKELEELCDSGIRIPMAEGVESLNAAVSAAIIMYEAVRQRG